MKDANSMVKHRNKFMSSAQHYRKLTEEKEKQQNKPLENEGSVMRTVKICRANSGIEKENIEEVEEVDSMQDLVDKTALKAERLNKQDKELSVDLSEESKQSNSFQEESMKSK